MVENKGSVCQSFRCWTCSTSSRSFFTLTTHFMDEKWNLDVKLLIFVVISRDEFCYFNDLIYNTFVFNLSWILFLVIPLHCMDFFANGLILSCIVR